MVSENVKKSLYFIFFVVDKLHNKLKKKIHFLNLKINMMYSLQVS